MMCDDCLNGHIPSTAAPSSPERWRCLRRLQAAKTCAASERALSSRVMQRLALVVIESGLGIVFIHPRNAPPDAPASLPSGIVSDGETTEQGAVRLAHEQTGLHVAITERLLEFEQQGTPYGTALMTGYVARVSGGELRGGDEGPPVVYALDDLPAIIPERVANQRVLAEYLSRRRQGRPQVI